MKEKVGDKSKKKVRKSFKIWVNNGVYECMKAGKKPLRNKWLQ